MSDFISIATVSLGSLSVILAVAMAASLYRASRKRSGSSRKFSLALSFQLTGEAVMSVGVIAFTLAAHFSDWSTLDSNALRLFMFSVVFVTTIHLWRVMKGVQS